MIDRVATTPTPRATNAARAGRAGAAGPAHIAGPPPTPPSPPQNRILAKLPVEVLARISSRLELVSILLGTQLYGPGTPLRYAYFPTTAIVSLHYVTASGSSIETASVGNEGFVGVSIFMGDGLSTDAAVVQTSGYAYRLPRAILHAEFQRESALRKMLLRYTQSMMAQILVNAACNRHHVIEQQVARLLLRTLDRFSGGDLLITQELIASILGVRREGVTEAAGNLQQAGIIHYRRGHISVLNREALEARACECYGVIKLEWARLDQYTG